MKNKNKVLAVLCLMALMANGDAVAVSSVLLDIAKDLDVEVTEAALSITAFLTGFGVFTLLFGPLSDRFGKVRIITIAGTGSAIFSILSGFSWDIYSLIFFRACGGIFAAGIMPVALSLTGDTFNGEQSAIAKVLSFAFIGASTATIIGGSLAYFASWRFVYIFYGVLRLILSLLMLKFLERDTPTSQEFNLVKFYTAAFRNKNLMLIIAVLLINGIAVRGSFSYSGVLIADKTLYNTLIIGIMLSAFGFGAILEHNISYVLKKIFPKVFLFVCGITGFIAYLNLTYANNAFLLVFALGVLGLSFIIVQSTLIANAQGRLPQMKGTVMSMVSFCMNMGGALGTQMNTFVLGFYGLEQIFLISGLLFIIVSMFATAFVRR